MAPVGILFCLAGSTARYVASRNSNSARLLKIVSGTSMRVASIYSKTTREPVPKQLPPFPYKTKKLSEWKCFWETTTDRFDENSKILVVEGNIAAGKTTLAKELANQLDMLYIPEANMDMEYINSYGYDQRDYKHLIPDAVAPFDVKDFYTNPNHMNAFAFQFTMYKLRLGQYVDALAHVFNTGQGVVMDRCVYSDFCFLETMVKFGYIGKAAQEYYYQVKANSIGEILKPHLVIYLDVPVNVIQERIKKRGRTEELKTKVLTNEYLQALEEVYKYKYLKEIGKHAELLIYDWSTYGDIEVVVEDIERVKFIEEDNYDPKLKDWRLHLEENWKEKRYYFTNQKEHIISFLRVPPYNVPEFMGESEDMEAYNEVLDSIPGNKYAPGFNADVGDKNLWFKH